MTEREKYINALNGLKNADIKIDDEIRYPSIKALEKQIAKKPVKRSFIVPYEGINVCPSCKKPLVKKEHHCKCGQKLDWENEDEKKET